MRTIQLILLSLALFSLPTLSDSQRPDYGPPIKLSEARVVMKAAEDVASAQNWRVAIAILDSGCNLVLLQKMDNTQLASPRIAQDKAYTACAFRIPSAQAQQTLAEGQAGLRYLQLNGMTAVEGGLPLLRSNQLIGAIGVSGVTSQQDGVIALAGAEVLR
ncbi:GlcG/HbpS family heme-binding protein [Kistimonas asteriae]|uniref:GlcG/HbpS family heme-binding protein n=1 Tax=Kistimonas asteriae TaxID=517724 RepID=UPI001BABC7B1|nr:heme-binding protein [Kistimonas asteriae]